MPILPPAPLSDASVNIATPVAPGNEITANDVYEAIQYRKAVEYARDLRKQTTKEEVAQAYLYEGRVLHSHKDLQPEAELPGWIRTLVDPIRGDIQTIKANVAPIQKMKTDIQTIKANVAEIPKMKDDIQAIKTNVEAAKATLDALQLDLHIIKVQAAKAANRQLFDGRAIPYDEVPSSEGKRPVEIGLDPVRSIEHLMTIPLDNMKKYYKFYYPTQRIGNRSLQTLREDVRIAIGSMVPIQE